MMSSLLRPSATTTRANSFPRAGRRQGPTFASYRSPIRVAQTPTRPAPTILNPGNGTAVRSGGMRPRHRAITIKFRLPNHTAAEIPTERRYSSATRRNAEDDMAGQDDWVDLGAAQELAQKPLRRYQVNNVDIALSFRDGTWGAVSNVCNHAGGPLGDGRLDQDYIVCPWHGWKFHRCTGFGEPGFEEDRVPSFPIRVEGGRVLVNIAAPTRRT